MTSSPTRAQHRRDERAAARAERPDKTRTDVRFGVCSACSRYGLLATDDQRCVPDGPLLGVKAPFHTRRDVCLRIEAKRAAA